MSFWTDSKIIDDFTPEDRYFYLYLMTNPHTTLSGCYEVSMKQIADETGYTRETVEKLINRLEAVHKVIVFSRDTKEVLLVNWSKYNWTSSEKFKRPLQREIQEIKNDSFKKYLSEVLKGGDTVSIPYRYRMDTVSNTDGYGIDTTDTDTVTDTVTDTDTDTVSDTGADTEGELEPYISLGIFGNVELKKSELLELKRLYPDDYQNMIENLSTYMKSTGKRYDDHFATLTRWARKDKETKPKKDADELDEFYDMVGNWARKAEAERLKNEGKEEGET